MEKVYIYTDGSSLGNPGPGGWGVVMKFKNKVRELSGGEKFTTNNRMELLAVIESLESIKVNKYPIEIYSDSKYVVDSISKGWVFNWAKKPNFGGKKNEDLWRRFLKVYPNFNITLNWVRGHNGHPENERCDKLATTESLKLKNDISA
jgi:ribonuclease HI